jgi:glycosyltransferase involved in cell wall biosynthesis
MSGIAINARFHAHRPTGVQRYASELAKRFAQGAEEIRPERVLVGPVGHLWEQLYLPAATRGRLLWSPSNTGPLAVAHQVCTVHDLIFLDHPEWFNPRFAAWYGWLLPLLAKKVRHIIAVSEYTKQALIEKLRVPPEKITVVLNGIDARFRPREPGEILQVRKRLGIGPEPYVLCVGSLEPRKNLGRLLEAWSQIQAELPRDIQLVIAGAKGKLGVFSNAQFRLPSRVHLTGYVGDEYLPALYSGALSTAYPSLYEGFGLPPLEAMACGSPVLTSNVTSLPEVVGDAAVLVDPLQTSSIGQGLVALIGNERLRESLRQKGLAWVKRFSWDRTAAETWQVLEANAAMK